MKKNKAITLIALIVTIIILLILAGVSIAFLTGENGILNKAKTAKDQSTQGEVEEQNRLGKTNETMDNYLITTRSGSLSDIIKYSSGVKIVSVTGGVSNNTGNYTVPQDGFISATGTFYTANQASASYIEVAILKNGEVFAWDQEASPSAGTYRMVSAAGMINVLKGDVIKMYYYSNVTGSYTYNFGYMFYPNS